MILCPFYIGKYSFGSIFRAVNVLRPIATYCRYELERLGVYLFGISFEYAEGLKADNALVAYFLESVDKALPIANVALSC